MGLPICFTITSGEVHDSKEAQNLINRTFREIKPSDLISSYAA